MNLYNFLKILWLRAKGWKIGKNVVIERNVVIHARKVCIGSDSHIGKGTVICADEVELGQNCLLFSDIRITVTKGFRLGDRCKISRCASIRAYDVTVGTELWCNECVDIGGGGWQKPTAVLTVGDFVHIGKSVSINVCAPVNIGSYTGIGIECMIFTHSSGNGQSVLEGYRHIEKPVSIGDHVSLFTRCFLCPGTIVKNYVTVAAMSFLSGVTEERGFYAGIPAKLKKHTVAVPFEDRLSVLFDCLREELSGYPDILCRQAENHIVVSQTCKETSDDFSSAKSNMVLITMQGTSDVDASAVFDLLNNSLTGSCTSLSELVRDKFRRLGILFKYLGYTCPPLNYSKLIQSGIEVP